MLCCKGERFALGWGFCFDIVVGEDTGQEGMHCVARGCDAGVDGVGLYLGIRRVECLLKSSSSRTLSCLQSGEEWCSARRVMLGHWGRATAALKPKGSLG